MTLDFFVLLVVAIVLAGVILMVLNRVFFGSRRR